MANPSLLFGKQGKLAAESWTGIGDEDEEDTEGGGFADIREKDNRTWSQNSKDDDPTLRRACIPELDLGTIAVSTPPRNRIRNLFSSWSQ